MQEMPARNAPCPCRSGKKYKICCAGRLISSPRSMGGVNSEVTLQAAIVAFQKGNHADAEALARRIPDSAPQAKHTLNLRAMIAHMTGQFAQALALYDQALLLDPAIPEFYNNRGNALQALKRYEEAQVCFEEAIRLRPTFAEAVNNFATTILDRGNPQGALPYYETALALRPDYPEVYENLGKVYEALGRPEEAAGAFLQAIHLEPYRSEYYGALGDVHLARGSYAEAIEAYEGAIRLKPNDGDSFNSLGKAYIALGCMEEAADAFLKTIQLDPQNPEHFSALGNVYLALGFHDAAIEAYEESIRLKPDFGSVLNNLGIAFHSIGRYGDAARRFEQARALEPWRAQIHNNLAGIFLLLGNDDAARASYAKAVEYDPAYLSGVEGFYQCLRVQCAWEELDEAGVNYTSLLRRLMMGNIPVLTSPFNAFTVPLDPLEQRALVERVSADIAIPLGALRNSLPATAPSRTDRRLRIGYISNDYRTHATAHLLGHLFARHDRTRFEVIAYSTGPNDGSGYRRRIEEEAERFVDLQGLPPVQAATQIRMDEVDILVDLHGHSVGGSLTTLALRPAPVQIHFLGYPGTVGKELVDYSLVDAVVCPPEHEHFYSEKVYRLPDTYHMNEHESPAASLSRAEYGLPDSGFIFCCFNAAYKLTPTIFRAWMRILKQTPGGVLWLYGSNQTVVRNLTAEAARCDIPGERILFGPHVAKDIHLARLQHADLMLDTPVVNAMTTASDALWAGVPVLSILGMSFPDRAGASLLTAIGLPELIMPDLETYEATAIHLAQHPEEIAALKAKLAANRHTYPLFDTARFVRNLETAYEDIWKRHLAEADACMPITARAL